MGLIPRPSLRVSVEQEVIYVHPNLRESNDADDWSDPLIRGTVVLSLHRSKAIKAIKIELVGLCDCFGGYSGVFPYETAATINKSLELNLGGDKLEAGDHGFSFSFLVPSDTAPFQRSAFGRTRHYLKAHVIFASPLSPTASSTPVAVWIMASEALPGDPPPPLAFTRELYEDNLGPILLNLTSPHLTVSALIAAQIHLVAPPRNVTIMSASLSVIQSFAVHYTKVPIVARPDGATVVLRKVDPSAVHSLPSRTQSLASPTRPPSLLPSLASSPSTSISPLITSAAPPPRPTAPPVPIDVPLFEPMPLHRLQEGEEWNYTCVFRVPDDEIVRPSTLGLTKTPIRVSHRLVLEMKYRIEGEEEARVLLVGKQVVIASCCCLADSLLLPAYSQSPPPPTGRTIENRCLCNMTLEEMVDREGFALERAGTVELPTLSGEMHNMSEERRRKSSSVNWHMEGDAVA